jgi:hypothetical protein
LEVKDLSVVVSEAAANVRHTTEERLDPELEQLETLEGLLLPWVLNLPTSFQLYIFRIASKLRGYL